MHALDGLRAVAALAVVIHHFTYFLQLLPYDTLGSTGVVVFFALSGYLIGDIVWRGEASSLAYLRFVRRRAQRLAPVVLALVFVGGPVLVLFGRMPAPSVARDGALALVQGTSFAAASGTETLVTFLPTWSLTVEWVFYLLFPVLLFALRRRGTAPGGAVRMLVVLAAGLYTSGLLLPDRQFYLLPAANLGVLVAGAALAAWHRGLGDAPRAVDPARTAMWLLPILVFVVAPGQPLGWAWKIAVFPTAVVASLVVIHGCRFGNAVTRWLAVGPIRQVGVRAYSLYVWHVPVLWLVWVNTPGWSRGAQAAVAVVALIGVVAVSYELLEKPVLRGGGAGHLRPSASRAGDGPMTGVPAAQFPSMPH